VRGSSRRPGLAAGAIVLLLAAGAGATGRLGSTGLRAFELAKSADDGAAAALEEGERTLAQLQALATPERAEALKPFREDGERSQRALETYRAHAQATSTEALQLLADAARVAAATPPDPARQEVLEQRGLLAAHEATVMAARARSEAERLRAVLAEARAALAGAGAPRAGGTARPAASPAAAPAAPGDIEVPNLVGARLEGATRDLEAAGLRLGSVTGPREGYVVKQEPEAGARVGRRSAVGVVLSSTAATVGGASSP
jgi:hypothetical protein